MTAKFVGRAIGLGMSLAMGGFVLPHFFPVDLVAAMLSTLGLTTAIYLAAEDIESAIRSRQP